MQAKGQTLARAVWQIINQFFVAQLGEALIDTSGLSFGLRVLTWLGYGSIFFLLLATVLFEVLWDDVRSLTYVNSDGVTLTVSVPVLAVCSFGLAAGWAFMLTGATDGRRRVTLPLIAFFALQLLLMVPQGSNGAIAAWCCGTVIFLGGLGGAHFFTKQNSFWRDSPLLEFAILFLGILFFVFLFTFYQATPSDVATGFNAIFNALMLPTILFWLFSGLAVIDLAVTVARVITKILRALFPVSVLSALTVLLLLIRPALAVVIFGLGWNDVPFAGALGFDIFVTGPLLVVTAVLALLGKWQPKMAMTVLALSFASPVFTLGIIQALYGGADISDTVELALGSLSFLPPLVLFVGLMAHSVLSAGATYASQDGPYLPRSGRVLVVFGAALLVTTFTLFFVNNRRVDTGQLDSALQELVNNAFAISVFFLGLPYLLWILFRRRERLIGDEDELAEVTPLFSQLERVSSQRWLLMGVITAVILSCFTCGLFAYLYTPQ